MTWDHDAALVTLSSSGWERPAGEGGSTGGADRDLIGISVRGDRLWALTDAGVSGHDRTTLAQLASMGW